MTKRNDVRNSIAACLLGETLGDGCGIDVLRVADLIIEGLPRHGWTFVRSDSWRLRKDFGVSGTVVMPEVHLPEGYEPPSAAVPPPRDAS